MINYTAIFLWGQTIPRVAPRHVAVPIPNPVYGAFFLLPPGRTLDVLCVVSSGSGFHPERLLSLYRCDEEMRGFFPCLGAQSTSLHKRISLHHAAHLLLS